MNYNYDIFFYFQLKTITSLLTGIFTFIILFFLENDLAPTFGIFAFFLNFIPFIGSLLSVLLPFIFSAVQFLNFFEPFLTFFLLLLIQIYIGNFLEPKFMGKTLNISPLVMIVFLTIIGKIWGVRLTGHHSWWKLWRYWIELFITLHCYGRN